LLFKENKSRIIKIVITTENPIDGFLILVIKMELIDNIIEIIYIKSI
jgi:hypothetical protein